MLRLPAPRPSPADLLLRASDRSLATAGMLPAERLGLVELRRREGLPRIPGAPSAAPPAFTLALAAGHGGAGAAQAKPATAQASSP